MDRSVRVKFMGGREVAAALCIRRRGEPQLSSQGMLRPTGRLAHSPSRDEAASPTAPTDPATRHAAPRPSTQVVGVLKGYDALLNLVRAPPSRAPARPAACPAAMAPVQVLDETKEFLKDPDDPYKLLDESRPMGLTVCRGTSVMLVCPTDGYEEIENPFLQDEEEDQPLG